MDRRTSSLAASTLMESQNRSPRVSIQDSFKVRRRQPIQTVVKVVGRKNSTITTGKDSVHLDDDSETTVNRTVLRKSTTVLFKPTTTVKVPAPPSEARSSISSMSRRSPPPLTVIPPTFNKTKTKGKSTTTVSGNTKSKTGGAEGKGAGASIQEQGGNGGPSAPQNPPFNQPSQEGPSQPSQKSPHSITKLGEKQKNVFSVETGEEYFRTKRDTVAQLAVLRDIQLAKRTELTRRTKIVKEQASITEGILSKEREVWTTENGHLSGPSPFVQYTLHQIMTKQNSLTNLLRQIKEQISGLIDIIAAAETRSVVGDVKHNLTVQSPLRMEGGAGLRQLIEETISAKINFAASENDTFVHVGNGKYYPPMVFALISVGILRFDEENPARVTLNCKLDRH